MTASLTDRYVAATVRGLDEAQRPEVERELLATIEDMVDARLEAGAPTRTDAEQAVLVELGDPVRLAAGYSGRPLHLIGPGVYPEWLRLVRVLLVVVVPISVVGNLVARLFVEDLATTDIGSLVGSSIALALTVALHVVFWTTLVFVVLERTGHASLDTWTPDQLPDTGGTGRVGFGETAASVVFLVLVALALVWQQTSSPIDERRGGRPGARPRAVVGLDPVAPRRARRPGGARDRRLPARSLDPPARRGRAFCSTSRSPCRCSCSCAPATCSTRRSWTGWSQRAGRTRSATSPRPRRSASSWCSSGASSRRCATRAPRTGAPRSAQA